ncbi:hypothetical protein DU57_06590 [Methanosarcina mazei]|uniref:Uncharacterized protein n=1 Tax=Methanosarcina mazei TaxID=2209 RepID=A0A0F8I1M0_METMZ|nr:hypothetical protein [Methanosarcina mazei]KKG30239.1 hypothetical protein DU49_09000 [Methanosarcina mazei]KKG37346.1 hypothetical protein DU35_16320 [Methanosarcina mazei]KKG46079.1 hypothetical protein DU39_14940 [Methanosarcina mazei]KKG50500.1 hypothetical protein DU38_14450 [Methanosarcina mazei]KKG90041.1 hypothetical protein DU57_06590 [Methanosarcina mazei]
MTIKAAVVVAVEVVVVEAAVVAAVEAEAASLRNLREMLKQRRFPGQPFQAVKLSGLNLKTMQPVLFMLPSMQSKTQAGPQPLLSS